MGFCIIFLGIGIAQSHLCYFAVGTLITEMYADKTPSALYQICFSKVWLWETSQKQTENSNCFTPNF